MNTNTNTNTRSAAPAAPVRFWRSNAKDSRTGEFIAGREAIAAYLPQTGSTPRPFLRETWEAVTSNAAAAAVTVGKSTAGRCYQVIMTPCKSSNAANLHAAFIGRNGSQPVWYFNGTGYASPTYRNLKWHDRLEVAETLMHGGAMTVIVTDELTGAEVVTVSIKWGNRSELGRYLKRSERGNKSLLLRMIAEAIAEAEGR